MFVEILWTLHVCSQVIPSWPLMRPCQLFPQSSAVLPSFFVVDIFPVFRSFILLIISCVMHVVKKSLASCNQHFGQMSTVHTVQLCLHFNTYVPGFLTSTTYTECPFHSGFPNKIAHTYYPYSHFVIWNNTLFFEKAPLIWIYVQETVIVATG